jgi:hypothetical protein
MAIHLLLFSLPTSFLNEIPLTASIMVLALSVGGESVPENDPL